MAGDAELAQRCARESTRLAQRSIMARTVLTPVRFDVGDAVHEVPAGWTIATLLPCSTRPQHPGSRSGTTTGGLTPARHRLRPRRHTCPARPFSLAAITTAVTALLATYDLAPRWSSCPAPVPAQIGSVARTDGQCLVSYGLR